MRSSSERPSRSGEVGGEGDTGIASFSSSAVPSADAAAGDGRVGVELMLDVLLFAVRFYVLVSIRHKIEVMASQSRATN